MRYRFLRAGFVLAVLMAAVVPAAAQVGFDRPGRDYASFPVLSGDPAACAQSCERDQRCRAWNFAYPTTVLAPAMCWLKGEIAPRVENPCCISGVKGVGVIEPRQGTSEFSIDRVGGDYRNFETSPDPAGQTCADACKSDPHCRAWSYSRPGYAGPARCWLKERVTRPRHAPCCVSGVVR